MRVIKGPSCDDSPSLQVKRNTQGARSKKEKSEMRMMKAKEDEDGKCEGDRDEVVVEW